MTHRLGALKCDAFDLDWSVRLAANKPFTHFISGGPPTRARRTGRPSRMIGFESDAYRGSFTSWDRSSPCFVYDKVRIPCAFVTHYGELLIDDKTPLLRSQDAVAREGLRLLKACGVEKEATTMYAHWAGSRKRPELRER